MILFFSMKMNNSFTVLIHRLFANWFGKKNNALTNTQFASKLFIAFGGYFTEEKYNIFTSFFGDGIYSQAVCSKHKISCSRNI
jgi:hypothetical protein